jgi:phosphatidylserine decarboxylase
VLLTALPKLLLSRTVRVLTHVPLPRWLRRRAYGIYARRYGANLDEMAGDLGDYPNLAAFFQRALVEGARPIDASAPFVWPADGRAVSAGPFTGDRLPQIKDVDYGVRDLLADDELASSLDRGSQATVYLDPGDYHRVHAPFDAEVVRAIHVPGGLFPVNRGAVRSIPRLFVRNERMVLACRLDDGRAAAVVLVAALNVSDTSITCPIPGRIAKGDEIGRFGMGSTVVVLVAEGTPALPWVEPETVARVGQAVAT